MQHYGFIFAGVKPGGLPYHCDSLSHIVYNKTLLRNAFIFSSSWWFCILFCLLSIFVIQKQQISRCMEINITALNLQILQIRQIDSIDRVCSVVDILLKVQFEKIANQWLQWSRKHAYNLSTHCVFYTDMICVF